MVTHLESNLHWTVPLHSLAASYSLSSPPPDNRRPRSPCAGHLSATKLPPCVAHAPAPAHEMTYARQGSCSKQRTPRTRHLPSGAANTPDVMLRRLTCVSCLLSGTRPEGNKRPSSGLLPLPMTRPHLSAGTVYVISWMPPGVPMLQSPRPRPLPLATARPPKPSLSWEGRQAQVKTSAIATSALHLQEGGRVTGCNQCHT